jgi:hypothetical protein
VPRPLFLGHRDWDEAGDRELARVPFGSAADRLLAAAQRLTKDLEPGVTVVVTGDDSGWAACSLAALMPDRPVVCALAARGPLGRAGARRWLAASDAPGNLTVVTADAGDKAGARETAGAVIDWAALEPGAAPAARADDPSLLFALVNPDAPIDLDRAQVGERLLSDMEVKVLYWASRAASLARGRNRQPSHGTHKADPLLRT